MSHMEKDKLIAEYGWLVKYIAKGVAYKLPDGFGLGLNDLIQIGYIGMFEASEKHDAKKADFKTYASIRIKGAMKDEIRRNRWKSRSAQSKDKKISEAVKRVESDGRKAKRTDVAEMLGVDLSDYYKMLQASRGHCVLNFGDLGVEDKVVVVNTEDDPLALLEKSKLESFLAEIIDDLPDRERLVIALYYDEELNLREIGSVLGVTESRVSQIRAQAIIRLQSKAQEWMGEEIMA